jgi:hypothetical protein
MARPAPSRRRFERRTLQFICYGGARCSERQTLQFICDLTQFLYGALTV